MRNGLLGTIAVLAASAALSFAQPPAPMPPAAASPAMGLGGLPSAEGPFPYGAPAEAPGLFNGMGGTYGPEGPGFDTERGWVNFDTLVWFTRDLTPSFPLITAGTTLSGGGFPDIGTTTVFSADDFNFNPLIGARFGFGRWSRTNPNRGYEAIGFVTEKGHDAFNIAAQDQVIARPFIDADTGLPNSFLVAFPGFARGSIGASVNTQIWGLELNALRRPGADSTKRFTFLFGIRYIDLKEDLSIRSRSELLAVSTFFGLPAAPGSIIEVADSFDARNQYVAAQFGLQSDWRYRRWIVNASTKLGLGGVYQSLVIAGSSAITPPPLPPGGGRNEVLGGLLAVDSNIGRHRTGRFVVIPEGKIQATYRMTQCADFGLGYTFTYLSQALRASDQIDPQVSTTRVPTAGAFGFPAGAFRPIPRLVESDYWIQGLNVNLSIHF